MVGIRHRLSTAGRVALTVLVLLLCVASLVGCSGGQASTSGKASADKATIGKTLRAGDWEVTLTGVSEKIKVVGQGDITYQAKGIYVIVPLKVKNVGSDMQLLAASDIALMDAQGNEFQPTQSAVQVAYGLPRGMEIIMDSPLGAGATRESIIIFDVPASAKGLQLALKGAQDRLDLGF